MPPASDPPQLAPSLHALLAPRPPRPRPPASQAACRPSFYASLSTGQNAIALSDANKHLIRCAWEGTEAFDDQYDDWNEASFIMKDQGSTKCAAGTELTESECEAHAGAVAGLTYKNKIIQGEVSLYPSGCWEYSDQGNLLGTVYFNEAPSSHQVTSASAAPICKRVCE